MAAGRVRGLCVCCLLTALCIRARPYWLHAFMRPFVRACTCLCSLQKEEEMKAKRRQQTEVPTEDKRANGHSANLPISQFITVVVNFMEIEDTKLKVYLCI